MNGTNDFFFHMSAPQHTYHDWLKVLAKTVANLMNIEIDSDQNLVRSGKSGTHWETFPKRVQERMLIKSLYGIDWANFFNNSESEKRFN